MLQLSKLDPVADRVVIKKDTLDKMTAGGLFVPQTAKNRKRTATVLKAGKKATLKEGDRVYFLKKNPLEIETDRGQVMIVPELDILAVVP